VPLSTDERQQGHRLFQPLTAALSVTATLQPTPAPQPGTEPVGARAVQRFVEDATAHAVRAAEKLQVYISNECGFEWEEGGVLGVTRLWGWV
jgi:hypothetical protein